MPQQLSCRGFIKIVTDFIIILHVKKHVFFKISIINPQTLNISILVKHISLTSLFRQAGKTRNWDLVKFQSREIRY